MKNNSLLLVFETYINRIIPYGFRVCLCLSQGYRMSLLVCLLFETGSCCVAQAASGASCLSLSNANMPGSILWIRYCCCFELGFELRALGLLGSYSTT
jgi:hypothetical protein